MSGWAHRNANDGLRPKPHPAEPHYGGDWTCYVCRQAVVLDGRAPNMSAIRDFDVFVAPQTVDPEHPGLETEGS